MSSRMLSRLLPVAEGDVSVYESVRRDAIRQPDIEARPGTANHERFHDEDDDPEALLYDDVTDDGPSQSATVSPEIRGADLWLGKKGSRKAEEDEDVPESLLLEDRTRRNAPQQAPESSQVRTEAQWKAAQQQRLHASVMPGRPRTSSSRPQIATASPPQPNPQTAATWQYTNAHNLDAFLLEVYQYYTGHGIWSICLSRAISLTTELFVFSFATFLTTCVDYTKVPTSKSTGEVMIPKCMAKAPWWKNALMFLFIIYWLGQSVRYIGDVRRLLRMHTFYSHVLGIGDQDIQTVSWVRVVDGLVKLHNANIATADPGPAVRKYAKYSKPQQRMNAETIANRLMRQANYYVAMYNKEIFDFHLPVPFLGQRHFYSKSLEWGIDFCLTNFIFDEQGSIRPFCLEVRNRQALVQALQTRLRFAALTSILVAPLNIMRFCVYFFFRYYTEFSRNPSKASARSFTPFAEWKMREFNELDHLFERRIRQAYQPANQYLRQFPKDKVDQICRFVAFITGAIASVLALATLFDPELFLGFEVTPGRTAVFWLTVMIGVFGVAQGSLPDEDEVHDPVLHLRAVLFYTHYIPSHWKDRLHSTEVRSEFSAMYQLKITIFAEEILSLIVAPLILLRNAGKRSERIIDFFREQTVHVDGIGHQCNFAVFGFKKDLNAADPETLLEEPDGLRDEYFGLKDDKMAASVQNFMQYYSHYNQQRQQGTKRGWQPPPAWPPMLASDAMGEENTGRYTHSGVPGRVAQIKRSTVLDQPPKRRPGARDSPAQAAVDRRPNNRSGRVENKFLNVASPPSMHAVSESVMMQNDSDLHEMLQQPVGREEGTESDTDADEDGNGNGKEDEVGNPGVLGMLYQFSKAQAERGHGVGI
ncbi:autophagy protein atg9 [Recurvomyces mirabilis]|nr:autophagy protein atg9 [Recurvomyces mirabilis]